MEQDEGFGCRPTVTALGLLAAFVVIAATAGVSLALGEGCDGICETAGFTLYAAALPASALFARYAERREMSVPAAVVRAIVAALVYGFVIALFLESVDV